MRGLCKTMTESSQIIRGSGDGWNKYVSIRILNLMERCGLEALACSTHIIYQDVPYVVTSERATCTP